MSVLIPRFPSAIAVVAILAVTCTAACSSTAVGNGSSDGGSGGPNASRGSSGSSSGASVVPTEKNAPLGASCHCTDFGGCCAPGLFCRFPGACNVQTATGCYSEGLCEEKLRAGESCHDPRECGDPGAVCTGLHGCFVSPSATIRCQASIDCPDGRTCLDSYCKALSGESCFESADCASAACSGGKCL